MNAQHLVFIAHEVTSEMVRDGTSTLKLELVLLHQLVHNGLRIFASNGQVVDVGADVLPDKISTGLVECEHVKAKIGKALRADGSPCVWKKFPPARGQKGFLS